MQTKRKRPKTHLTRILAFIVFCMLLLTACGSPQLSSLEGFPAADMSGYAALEGDTGEMPYVDMTVKDIDRLLKEGGTFVFFASFSDCPWCNAVLPHLTTVAREKNAAIGLLDTRKDPTWTNNTEIKDYALFLEDFGAYLDLDEEEQPHLYVPHIFFVKKGEVVFEHQGALPEMGDDPHMELDEAQVKALEDIFREGFRKL